MHRGRGHFHLFHNPPYKRHNQSKNQINKLQTIKMKLSLEMEKVKEREEEEEGGEGGEVGHNKADEECRNLLTYGIDVISISPENVVVASCSFYENRIDIESFDIL